MSAETTTTTTNQERDLAVDIQGHRAESERLGRLVEFLREFGPNSKHSGIGFNPELAGDVAGQRSRAIAESFRAVARIASYSFPLPSEDCPL